MHCRAYLRLRQCILRMHHDLHSAVMSWENLQPSSDSHVDKHIVLIISSCITQGADRLTSGQDNSYGLFPSATLSGFSAKHPRWHSQHDTGSQRVTSLVARRSF